MKFKIIFGIALPVIIIVILVILGSLDIGFSVKKKFIDKLSLQDIFTQDYQIKNAIKIADITLENNYFLGKRYDLPGLGICLDDIEGNHPRIEAGSLLYGEGQYNYEKGGFIYQETDMYRSYPYYGSNRAEAKNIQIGANEKKNIRIFLQPSYQFAYRNYTELIQQYKEYDSLLIFETDNNRNLYYACNDLDQETLDKAISIPIEQKSL